MAEQLNERQHRHPLVVLLELCGRARTAESAEELAFLVVNDSYALKPYRQAVLWLEDRGVNTLSGVIEADLNAPYAHWIESVCQTLFNIQPEACVIGARSLPVTLANEWSQWLPPYGLWLPFSGGGLLFAAEQPWVDDDIALFKEWVAAWQYIWRSCNSSGVWSWRRLGHTVAGVMAAKSARPWWRQRKLLAVLLTVAILSFPVHLSVLAPGELVPANPAVIRAPLDGVIAQFHVQPNQVVKKGQLLFNFDEASIAARAEVAAQALASARAEYRQFFQQALSDPRSKTQLAILAGKIEEKQAEADYAKGQLERSHVVAPQAGIALFDDPAEWIGRPVQVGERVMRVAVPGDVEIEAWLAIGDAIALQDGAPVSLYLAAAPLSPVAAHLRYVAHDSVPRPDGSYAYRVRARLEEGTQQRVGLKGTAKISGSWTPFIYWILRRPLAVIRQYVGL